MSRLTPADKTRLTSERSAHAARREDLTRRIAQIDAQLAADRQARAIDLSKRIEEQDKVRASESARAKNPPDPRLPRGDDA